MLLTSVLVVAALGQSATPTSLEELSSQLIAEVNRARVENKKSELVVDQSLANASKWLAQDMAKYGYFGHEDREGKDCGDRAKKFGYQRYRVVRENLAMTGKSKGAKDTVRLWLESPHHRENLLAGDVNDLGVGIAVRQNGQINWVLLVGAKQPDRVNAPGI